MVLMWILSFHTPWNSVLSKPWVGNVYPIMIIFKKLKVLNRGQNKNKALFLVPYIAAQAVWTKDAVENQPICRETLGILYRYGWCGLKFLIDHAENNTLPVHE